MTSRYEDELWSELVKRGEPLDGEHPPAPPWRPRGPWAATGGAGVLAAAATGAVLVYSAISEPTPAYAVTRNHDGSVKVWLREASGIKGLNARLKAMKVPAQAVLVAGGCPSSEALVAAAPRAVGKLRWETRGRAVVRPAETPLRMHILLVRRGAHGRVSLGDVVGRPPAGAAVPACVNQVRVAVARHGALPRSVVVRPLKLVGPTTCMPPARGSGAATTATATTTTATATTPASGATTATATATTPASGATTTATTSGSATRTTESPIPSRSVWCCKVVVRGGGSTNGGGSTTGTATATSGGTTTAAGTATTGGTTTAAGTTTSGAAGTMRPPRNLRCRVLRSRIGAVPTGTLTSTATQTETRTATTR